MTEQEWLTSNDLEQLMKPFSNRPNARKFYLFNVACCRRIWHLLDDQRTQTAIEVLELYADYLVSDVEISAIHAEIPFWDGKAATKAVDRALAHAAGKGDLLTACQLAADYACDATALGADAKWSVFNRYKAMAGQVGPGFDAFRIERVEECHLFRDIFFAFPAARFDSHWLAWNCGTVAKLAQGIYEERAFERMPILADALEDAGCCDTEILAHCRGPGPHVKGCWVLDMLLQKE